MGKNPVLNVVGLLLFEPNYFMVDTQVGPTWMCNFLVL